jgi:hypothetical protein
MNAHFHKTTIDPELVDVRIAREYPMRTGTLKRTFSRCRSGIVVELPPVMATNQKLSDTAAGITDGPDIGKAGGWLLQLLL